ncbi:uncharacterized protein LOC122854162 [Aphidius gifuensis]|uniref:uncharacterized protein LOC122854162 n=1 Tax=Aphidius gifuensis TaxID=684658 RepID=UPI001CDC9C1B|nr:uncharacterized protein LOC122854162 [Aphidius gifuensis]
MGIKKNTPEYIWGRESGVDTIKEKMTRRAINYIEKIIKMEDSRLAKICLREECRGILNKNMTRWENYWNEKGVSACNKESWARMKCGNVGRAYKSEKVINEKEEWNCRMCGNYRETLEHILVCPMLRDKCDKRVNKEMDSMFKEKRNKEGVTNRFDIISTHW